MTHINGKRIKFVWLDVYLSTAYLNTTHTKKMYRQNRIVCLYTFTHYYVRVTRVHDICVHVCILRDRIFLFYILLDPWEIFPPETQHIIRHPSTISFRSTLNTWQSPRPRPFSRRIVRSNEKLTDTATKMTIVQKRRTCIKNRIRVRPVSDNSKPFVSTRTMRLSTVLESEK